MQEIGFWNGLSMAYSAAIGATVRSLNAVEKTAGAADNVASGLEKTTAVLPTMAQGWHDQVMDDLAKAKALRATI
jgi:hypothetical protein